MAKTASSSPLKKLFKFVLIAGGVFVGLVIVLLIAAAIIVPIKFPPSKLKAMAEEKLTDSLHHKVTVGDVHFSVFSGFEIKNLKIANRAGWDPRPLVSAQDISISYNLFPLLWGEVSLGEVKLNQPDILVEKRGPGQFNFSDMSGTEVAQAAPAPVKAVPKAKGKAKPKKKAKKHAALIVPQDEPVVSTFFADAAWADTPSATVPASSPVKNISIGSVNILHGKMIYLDKTVSPLQESDLNDLNVKVKNISMVGGKSSFTIDTPLSYNKMAYKLTVSGGFRYFLSSQSLKEVDVKGDVNGLGFKFSGDALNMTTNLTPTMDGEASLNMLQFAGLVPKSLSQMPVGLSLTGPAKVDFHLAGTMNDGLQLSGTADGSQLAIKFKDLFVKTDKTNCKIDFKTVNNLNKGIYDVPSFKVVYDQWEVTGSFHYQNGAAWSCKVHSDSLPFKGLPGMLPKLKNTAIDGGGSLDLNIAQAKGAIPYMINGQVALKGVGITLPQEPYLQSMNGTLSITNNVARLPALTFQSFDGNGSISMTFNANTLAYTYGFSLKNVNAQKAIDASIDAYVTTKDLTAYKGKMYGTMNLAYSGSGKGTSGDQMMASQVGSGNYSMVNAKVKGIAAIKTINSYLKDNSDEMGFEKIDGVLAMKNSVFTYTANTNGKVGAIREKGGMNVVQMVYSPDMSIQCDIKKDFVNTAAVQSALPGGIGSLIKDPSFLADDNGNIPVDLKFTGPVSENHYSWDTARIGAVVQKHAGAAIQKAAQPVLNDVGNKLKSLFH